VLRRHGWGERRGKPAGHGARDGLGEEVVAGEAAVARPALRVEETDGRPPVRRPVVVLRDADLRPLADDLAAEADPAAPPQLEAEPGALLQGAPERRGNPGRLEDEEERAGAAGERDEAAEPVGEPGRAGAGAAGGRRRMDDGRCRARQGPVPCPREVEDEEVDRPRLEERPRHRERLVDGARDEDREPLQAHAAGRRLHGIEAPGEVHPGHEGAAGLGLRDRPQGERRRAAGSVAPESDRPGSREAAGCEQRVELREAGGDAVVDVPRRLAGERPGRGRGCRMGAAGQGHQRRPDRTREDPGHSGRSGERGERGGRPGLRRERGGRERPEDLHSGPRCGRSPAGPEARKGGGAVGVAIHRTANTRTDVLHLEEENGPFQGQARRAASRARLSPQPMRIVTLKRGNAANHAIRRNPERDHPRSHRPARYRVTTPSLARERTVLVRPGGAEPPRDSWSAGGRRDARFGQRSSVALPQEQLRPKVDVGPGETAGSARAMTSWLNR